MKRSANISYSGAGVSSEIGVSDRRERRKDVVFGLVILVIIGVVIWYLFTKFKSVSNLLSPVTTTTKTITDLITTAGKTTIKTTDDLTKTVASSGVVTPLGQGFDWIERLNNPTITVKQEATDLNNLAIKAFDTATYSNALMGLNPFAPAINAAQAITGQDVGGLFSQVINSFRTQPTQSSDPTLQGK